MAIADLPYWHYIVLRTNLSNIDATMSRRPPCPLVYHTIYRPNLCTCWSSYASYEYYAVWYVVCRHYDSILVIIDAIVVLLRNSSNALNSDNIQYFEAYIRTSAADHLDDKSGVTD